DMPDPSPSSTRVATPDYSPPPSPLRESIQPERERSTILGKRASQDRDDSSVSADRSRHRGEDEMEVDGEGDVTLKADLSGMDTLGLKSPTPTVVDDQEMKYDPPSAPPPLPPRHPGKDHLSSGLKFGLQQDSAEVLINILTQLEMGLERPANPDGEKEPNVISSLFSCKFRQQIFYETSAGGTVEAQTPVESVFVPPIIGVEEEGKDLYDCLAELYLKGADIEYEGKKGYKMDLMDQLPPCLYIQMRRSQFDASTGRERKTNTHVAFGQQLVMDRFLASSDPKRREDSIELTREMLKVRSRLHELKNHKPLSIPATFQHVREGLQQLQDIPELDITEDFLNAIRVEGEGVAVEINGLESQIPALKAKIDAVWEDSQEIVYELVAVFMHRGKTSGAGHYWTYQSHLPDHDGKFFKYNDAEVTEVPAEEVLQDRTGSDANPALLCYVRKGRDLIDTLHREVV
ncbi:hypothetical protein P7C73_g5509, partial [Tremellales sp. Uapishka_1]